MRTINLDMKGEEGGLDLHDQVLCRHLLCKQCLARVLLIDFLVNEFQKHHRNRYFVI